MQTRKLNITIEIEDSDLIQFNLEKELDGVIGADKITSKLVLPNTDAMYERDPIFRLLIKKQKQAKDAVRDWINEHNV